MARGLGEVNGATGDEGSALNQKVRGILSENCFSCHGPDAKKGKNGKKVLRLDLPDVAKADLGNGRPAIVERQPEKSEMIHRISTTDLDDKMPPPDSGKKLTSQEIATLTKWVAQGAEYSRHWSYVKPLRPELPKVRAITWPRNGIDRFILARLERDQLKHQPEAEPSALIRRASLDLTGLPPTLAEVDQFLADRAPGAYERLVDRLLKKKSFGEHWARLWLDQARYADSSGYADDPARTIWAYRDYVIRALNANKPFDQFTLEQIAGDLLENPTDEQLVATAFHRNTMTNNEGGTSDEEFRNVAVVDRVNTTMSVWMGTTMGCAQCHNHKYDPITQEEYFRLFAILNNTADTDRFDETPIQVLYTPEQKLQKKKWETDKSRLEKILLAPTAEIAKEQSVWEKSFTTELQWETLHPADVKSKAGAGLQIAKDGMVKFERGGTNDVYTATVPLGTNENLTALRIEVVPDEKPPGRGVGHANGNFVVSRVSAVMVPANPTSIIGRYVRIELPGKEKILSLAEVQVFSGTTNLALHGTASQSSIASDGPAKLAIDGNTDGDYAKAKSTTHTENSTDPWWEVDLQASIPIDRISIWNRTDGSQSRLDGFAIKLLNDKRETVWQKQKLETPKVTMELAVDGTRSIEFATAVADFSQKNFSSTNVLNNNEPKTRGWAIGPEFGKPHFLTLIPKAPVATDAGFNLVVQIEQVSNYDYATIAQFRLSKSSDARAEEFAKVPWSTLGFLRVPSDQRTEDQRKEVLNYFLTVAPALQARRNELAGVRKQLNESKPYTSVPVLRELAGDQRRSTHVQRRGNFMDLGLEVTNSLPSSLYSQAEGGPSDRLALAKWLVDKDNPLTARVVINRLWESIFGVGLVRTSEEFGAQGELPSHPELMDWLAVELMSNKWDTKHLLRLMVTSAAYRQSSRVTPELAAQDPENRLLARGPRFRLSAEMIRDQSLLVSGLLSPKMYGPPVRPTQPKLGLTAAFGSGTDWETSSGEDSHRRAVYTTWRRSNPYPSMATFDAPSREVCLVRRERSNTPLQALVTMNDPVYVEAAQALARKIAAFGTTPEVNAQYGFRLCLSRKPTDAELNGLVLLYHKTYARFKGDQTKALAFASQALGGLDPKADASNLAAWTVVGNVLLNLDEMLMKR